MQAQLQPVGMAGADIQQPFARAVAGMVAVPSGATRTPAMPRFHQRRSLGSIEVVSQRAPAPVSTSEAALTERSSISRSGKSSTARMGMGALGRLPAGPAMAGRVQPGQPPQPAPQEKAIAAALDPLEMALHLRGASPGRR